MPLLNVAKKNLCAAVVQPLRRIFLHQIRTKIPITRIAKQCIKFLHHECTMNNIHF
nr:MAG TPA: hypothetical protein [Caudoviricetes sp.]